MRHFVFWRETLPKKRLRYPASILYYCCPHFLAVLYCAPFKTVNKEFLMAATEQTRAGVFNALGAYFMWGLAPLYFKLIDHISAGEILLHRVVWSCLLLFILVFAINKYRQFFSILLQPKVLLTLLATSLLLASNWFIFIWAINNNYMLDASLGYYINPLFNVALGMIFLGERLRKWQKFAVGLALLGVAVQVVTLGSLPVISLALAASFSVYGLLRKKLAIDTFVALLVESLMLLPIALGYWLFFLNSSTSNMFNNTVELNTLFVMAGVITTAPLLCFTAAAKRLTLSALGFFQYIGPSLMFLLATFVYFEPLAPAKLLTFGFIWTALLIFSVDSLKHTAKRNITK